MAEKEERILCIETDEKIIECGYGDFYNTMTRQEAIERMAKAAKKAYRGYFYAEPHHPNVSDMMEAALNALLEAADVPKNVKN